MGELLSTKRYKWLYLFIILAVLVNFSGLFVTIIGPDGALYASIAKTLVVKNNFIDLFVEGKDWLDKPHFPFWMAALSFKLFGISTWAYKLPAVLFVLLAAAYTYKFAKSLYNREVALWSVLILLTAQHIIVSNTDVRAEPYLIGLIIAGVYHFHKACGKFWFWHVLAGALFTACALMTKGIFALIPIGGAIVGELLIKREWRILLSIRWLIAAALIIIFILPELYCLYEQFDAHPEKLVFGRKDVSGLEFFFYDSQFGRFFNTGPIKRSAGDPFFFLHTILWAFLPWSILFYIAIVQFVRKYFNKVNKAEWYCISGTVLTVLVFSASKFQLPHYIVVIFPFFAILTAQYICGLKSDHYVKMVLITQKVVIILMILVLAAIHYFFSPIRVPYIFVLLLILFVLSMVLFSTHSTGARFKVFFQTIAVVVFINVYFNLVYYPELTKYQPDSEAAFWLNANNKNHLPVVKVSNGYSYAIDFYSNDGLFYYYPGGNKALLPPKPYLLYGEEDAISQLRREGLNIHSIKVFKSYPITKVKGKFLYSKTREETLGKSELVLVK